MKKVCSCGQEMYFDWGTGGDEHSRFLVAWYCSGPNGCGLSMSATKEEIKAKFEEEDEAHELGG